MKDGDALGSATLALSNAHDKARHLPAYRPERIEEVLWDWAENHDEQDIGKVMAELRQLFHEQERHEEAKRLPVPSKADILALDGQWRNEQAEVDRPACQQTFEEA